MSSPAVSSEAVAVESTSAEVHKSVAIWLLGMGGLVATMVSIGGITRLTRSGLSMTDWSITGRLPPTSHERWLEEFEIYKQFPEWQQRKSMTLDEFKFIFFWEYIHRMMGRFLGVAFVGPAAYFALRGRIPLRLVPRLTGLFALGGAQGLIGWWMVKSGLNLDTSSARGDPRQEVRVSPYRLATHLGMAFTTYSALLWTAFDILNSNTVAKATANSLSGSTLQVAKVIRRASFLNAALVATTVISGAYVAGNDAGRAFNTFPMMGEHWVPPEILQLTPLWRNFTENTATVQFDHRILALSTLTSILGTFAYAKSACQGMFWKECPRFAKIALHSIAGMSFVQVGLGIATLVMYVPVPLAVVHQGGSLALLTFSLAAAHSLKFSKFAPILAAAQKIAK
jgi:cytochrome c oxidase assembly protein subunit 15